MLTRSVVFLVDDAFAVEAGGLQLSPQLVHHIVQAADINVDIAAFTECVHDMGLDTAGQSRHSGDGRVSVGQ